MDLPYSEQLEMKRKRVLDALRCVGLEGACEVSPCIASPSPLGYRNKLQFPARQGVDGLQLGLYASGSNELVDIVGCPVHCELGERVYREVREILKRSGISPYDPATGRGELRHLLIKSAIRRGEVLVVLVTNGEATPLLSTIASDIMRGCAAVKGVVHNVQRARNNVVLGSEYHVLEGVGFIHEELCGLTFKISPASFFQINLFQAEQVYARALEFAELVGSETVLDAYCGVGTLALVFAGQAGRVMGVERVPQAIEDARENAQLNGIGNATFLCAEIGSVVGMLAGVDVVLLNPPRKGCDEALLEGIGRAGLKRLIYISCDPESLSRDLAHFCAVGYRLDAIQPFDMFPQTAHVECVAKLTAV